jgi:acetolactate synthase-1/2/3 large subunit
MTKSVAEVLSESLASSGITRLYGIPGGEVLDILHACHDVGIQFILTHHEASAAFMAAAEGQYSRKVSACISTLGPGATNLTTGIAHAYLDRCPVIVITGSTSTSVIEEHTHQNLDITRIFEPITKASYRMQADGAQEIVNNAINIASQEPFGPVSISIPRDVATQEISQKKFELKTLPQKIESSISIKDIAEKIKKSSKPLIVFGLGTPIETFKQMRDFCDTLGAPVGVTPKMKGLIDETNPLFTGTYGGMMADDIIRNFINTRDIVLCIGLDPVEIDVDWINQDRFLWFLPSVNVAQNKLPLNTWLGNISEGMRSLKSLLDGHSVNGKNDALKLRSQITAQLENTVVDKLIGFSPLHILKTLSKIWSLTKPVCSDVGSHKLLLGQYWPSSNPNCFFLSNGLSSMGFGISAPIAISLATSQGPVLSIIGDGGFLMYAGELETAMRVNAHVLYIIFRDCSLSLIENSQHRRGHARYGVRFETPDIVKLANSFKIPSWRISNEDQLEKIIIDFEKLSGPAVVEVPIDSREYIKQMG